MSDQDLPKHADYDTQAATLDEVLELVSEALMRLGRNNANEFVRFYCNETLRATHSYLKSKEPKTPVSAKTEEKDTPKK